MEEHLQQAVEASKPEQTSAEVTNAERIESQVVYRWTYADQLAHDADQTKKKRIRGAWSYALILAGMFLLCIALLCFTVIWYGGHPSSELDPQETELTTAEISEAISPAIVLIHTTHEKAYGFGTGFFVTSDGYIATNHHVIEGSTAIKVYLKSGKSYTATLVGYSEAEDLAVLKIQGQDFPTLPIGNSDTLRVGEKTVVVGNPGGAEAAFSTVDGIISALNRKVLVNEGKYTVELSMIQTSAPVNNGNSGGPIVNAQGEVIGIITRKLADFEGIGLALPINGSMNLINAIIQKGNTENVASGFSRIRPNLDVDEMQDVTKGKIFYINNKKYTAPCDGVILVTSGTKENPPILHSGDIICAINGETVSNVNALAEQLYRYRVGDRVVLKVWRAGEYQDITVELGKIEKS